MDSNPKLAGKIAGTSTRISPITSSIVSPVASPVNSRNNSPMVSPLMNADQENPHMFENVDDQPQTNYSMIKQMFDQMKKLKEDSTKQQQQLEAMEEENIRLKDKLAAKELVADESLVHRHSLVDRDDSLKEELRKEIEERFNSMKKVIVENTIACATVRVSQTLFSSIVLATFQ